MKKMKKNPQERLMRALCACRVYQHDFPFVLGPPIFE